MEPSWDSGMKVCANGLGRMTKIARSNLVPYAFVWKKGNTMDFSETVVVYDMKVGRCSQPNDFNFTSNLRMIKVWY